MRKSLDALSDNGKAKEDLYKLIDMIKQCKTHKSYNKEIL